MPPSPSPEPLLSPREVAALLGICRSTLYSLIHRGLLCKPVQVGGQSRWKREDVEKVMNTPRRLRKPKRPGERHTVEEPDASN